MSSAVLDASAVLALLNAEPGSEIVADAIANGAIISAVNFSEVVAKLADAGMAEDQIRATMGLLGIQLTVFDEPSAYQAGVLRPSTRAAGLSFGDRACLALAQRLGLPALTADRAWERLSLGITIQVARPPSP